MTNSFTIRNIILPTDVKFSRHIENDAPAVPAGGANGLAAALPMAAAANGVATVRVGNAANRPITFLGHITKCGISIKDNVTAEVRTNHDALDISSLREAYAAGNINLNNLEFCDIAFEQTDDSKFPTTINFINTDTQASHPAFMQADKQYTDNPTVIFDSINASLNLDHSAISLSITNRSDIQLELSNHSSATIGIPGLDSYYLSSLNIDDSSELRIEGIEKSFSNISFSTSYFGYILTQLNQDIAMLSDAAPGTINMNIDFAMLRELSSNKKLLDFVNYMYREIGLDKSGTEILSLINSKFESLASLSKTNQFLAKLGINIVAEISDFLSFDINFSEENDTPLLAEFAELAE